MTRDLRELMVMRIMNEEVKTVMFALCSLLEIKDTWDEAIRDVLLDRSFLRKVQGYDKANVSMDRINYIKMHFTEHSVNSHYFVPEVIKAKSIPATSAALWVTNVVKYRTLVHQMNGGEES